MRSAHFSEAEVACHHCGRNGFQAEGFAMLEAFRAGVADEAAKRGIPFTGFTPDSAYRCPERNAMTPGAAKNSEHVQGIAADVRVAGFTAAELEAIARRIPMIKGIGRDDHFGYVHIDCRPDPAQWCYAFDQGTKQSKWVAYYPAGVQA